MTTPELSHLLENCVFSQLDNEIAIQALSPETTDSLYKQQRRLRQAAAATGITRIVFGDTNENWNIAVRQKDLPQN